MSLFDQFENADVVEAPVQAFAPIQTASNPPAGVSQPSKPAPVLLEQGFVSTAVPSQRLPVFCMDKVQFPFPIPKIRAVVVASNFLAVAVEGAAAGKDGTRQQRILRIDLGKVDAIEDVELQPRTKGDRVRRIFLDPTARHLLISTETGDNYYLHEKWKKPRILSKFRGILMESVAWGRPRVATDPSTGIMLVGSRQGHIYEAELSPTDEFMKREERHFKQVYTINDDNSPIVGLRYERFPAVPNKYFVIAATPTRLYQFIGLVADGGDGGMFGDLFRHYDAQSGYQEIPGAIGNSELQFWSQYLEESGFPSIPKSFAWLTGPGIYHGSLVFGNQNAGDSVVDNAQLLPYPQSSQNPPTSPSELNANDVPISINITEFHYILLFRDRVKAIHALNGEVVYDEEIGMEFGESIVAMTSDPVKNTYWIYTTMALYELIVTDEDRDVWRLYLEKKSFDAALVYAKDDAQRDKIVTSQAEYYFSQGRYVLSAAYYAQSVSLSFEEIALRFIAKNERDALKHYLLKKLERLKRQDATQITLLCTWLVEIFINRLNVLRDEVDNAAASVVGLSASSSTPPAEITEAQSRQRRAEEEEKVARDEFRQFLRTYKERLDFGTTYGLIASHGRTEELLFYAELVGDWDRVVGHWVGEREWGRAIEVISRQSSLDPYYKFSPILMEFAPYETVNAWIKQPNLNPRSLIPALLKYEMSGGTAGRSGGVGGATAAETQNQAIRYLQYAIQKLGNTDRAVHNYLLSLYVGQSGPGREEGLLGFLRDEKEDPRYDMQYALRLCSQHQLTEACVQIYSAMGLYEQAVALALKHNDLELARINADKPEDDDALRKKLWLRIARYVVEEKRDIKQAMTYLKQTDLLKIEDVLPFFPDFVLIDEFKEEICKALEEYNEHIEGLKGEMDEAMRSAESIRVDVRELRNRHATIPVTERCQQCSQPLLTRQFYVFPCRHVFHADCLVGVVVAGVDERRRRRILDVQEGIARGVGVGVGKKGGGGEETGGKVGSGGVEKLKEELDDLVANECVLCGDLMIRSVDKPFVRPDETDEIASWAL
ncbi:hypothetical protein HDV00_010151 [Rhizophlyctis rosea]|nr:hypothetical protein HDV00_010151 [Rhizophlyctis rosea]